jgi:hypothetical protein
MGKDIPGFHDGEPIAGPDFRSWLDADVASGIFLRLLPYAENFLPPA